MKEVENHWCRVTCIRIFAVFLCRNDKSILKQLSSLFFKAPLSWVHCVWINIGPSPWEECWAEQGWRWRRHLLHCSGERPRAWRPRALSQNVGHGLHPGAQGPRLACLLFTPLFVWAVDHKHEGRNCSLTKKSLWHSSNDSWSYFVPTE